MKFSFKVFLATFSIIGVMLLVSGALILRFVTTQTTTEYVKRYQNLSKQVGDTLVQIDETTDRILTNALYVLREREKVSGLPSNADLLKLKAELGIDTLYITDRLGKYLRSDYYLTVRDDAEMMAALQGRQPLTKPLFSYCKDYQHLVSGRSPLEKTPIIPSGQSRWPYKFLMIPNHDRTRILEADMAMTSIGQILRNAMEPDPSIASIGLFTPDGDVLGYVHAGENGGKPISHLSLGKISFSSPQTTDSSLAFLSKVHTVSGDCCECRAKGLTSPDGAYYYILRTEVSRKALNEKLADIRDWFLRMGFFALLLSGIVAFLVSRRLVEKLAWMGERVKKIAESKNLKMRLRMAGKDEVAALAAGFDGMMDQLEASQSRLADAEKEKALVELARQVAHDIRSPLAALDSVASIVSHLPEEQRLIARSAVSRIHDIANHLLEKHHKQAHGDETEVLLLSSLIAPVISEKRMEFRSRLGIEIEARLDSSSYGLFAEVKPTEFKRLLSNLIQNGVEAIEDKGLVRIALSRDNDWTLLQVQDNGIGIPKEILCKLGGRGETHGKPGGSGLGLYHAKTCAESWGGSFEISSENETGSTVSMRLPPASSPAWFVSELKLVPGTAVVVLDDDTTIHQVWQGRFDGLAPGGRGVETIHFSTAGELRGWVKENPVAGKGATYLLDYELRGSKDTGLRLAEELDLGDRAILVTSRFEERPILDECLRLGVRMVPKGLAGFVPITIEAAVIEEWDAVLIDDDPLVRMTWQVAAAQAEKRLRVFSSPVDFFHEAEGFNRETPVYLDQELGGPVKGDEVGRQICELGFKKIHLATGHERESLPAMPWIKEVVGKETPWS